jgi:glycosyltransferase involved in cell wall biosynthesis
MAAGLPVACSDIEPVCTISAGAALHFDPRQPASITAALLRLLDDDRLRDRLVTAGPQRAAEFSWRRTAAQTLQALEEACGTD